MPRRLPVLSSCFCLAFAGCIVPKDAKPEVDLGIEGATRFVHRGMTQVDNEVLQPHLDVGLPTTTGGRIATKASGNIDLNDDTGDAWFPDGHAGRFTEIEMVAQYEQKFASVSLVAGLHSYNLPNGQEFQNGERGGTNELFVLASTEILEANPYVSVHYDFDEVKDFYARAGLFEEFPIGGDFTLELDGSYGYAGGDQSEWMYGLNDPSWADLRGSIQLNYAYDERTTLGLGVHGSTFLDDTKEQWFRDLGIASDVIWVSLGVNWSF